MGLLLHQLIAGDQLFAVQDFSYVVLHVFSGAVDLDKGSDGDLVHPVSVGGKRRKRTAAPSISDLAVAAFDLKRKAREDVIIFLVNFLTTAALATPVFAINGEYRGGGYYALWGI